MRCAGYEAARAGGSCGQQCAAVTTSRRARASTRKPRPSPTVTIAAMSDDHKASSLAMSITSAVVRPDSPTALSVPEPFGDVDQPLLVRS